jgi:hypothetical protein
VQDAIDNEITVLKLADLHAKTDRQLMELINRKLDLGLTLASEPLPEASDSHSAAQSAYNEARLLLPLMRRASRAERARLEERFARLRHLLERFARRAGNRVQAACC